MVVVVVAARRLVVVQVVGRRIALEQVAQKVVAENLAGEWVVAAEETAVTAVVGAQVCGTGRYRDWIGD